MLKLANFHCFGGMAIANIKITFPQLAVKTQQTEKKMKKFTNLGKKLFVFKSWQSFALCLTTSSVATLLFSFQFQSKVLSSSPSDNVINVKSEIKIAQARPVTRENSSCARVFVQTLQEDMEIEKVEAVWESNGQQYIYSEAAGTKSNNKSLKNDEQSVKQKVIRSANFLAAADHTRIDKRIISKVRRAVLNDGAKLIIMKVWGKYKSDGQPCYITFDDSQECPYCPHSYKLLQYNGILVS